MKKTLLLALLAVAGIVMTGCTTVNTNDSAADSKAAIVPALFEQQLELGEAKVAGEAQLNVLFGVFSWGVSKFADRAYIGTAKEAGVLALLPDPVCKVKSAAVYNACDAANCDLIVGTKYTIDVTDYFVFKTINCKVTGYPAVEKGVKLVSKADRAVDVK